MTDENVNLLRDLKFVSSYFIIEITLTHKAFLKKTFFSICSK